MIQAEIIADSVAPQGDRCTTFLLTMPRIVLAEFNTHRMLTRNSASSRAVPFEKMVQRVRDNPFVPIKWMKDHKGMQGNEYLDEVDSVLAKADWLAARTKAADTATLLHDKGVTKQFVNRLLEPFMWHKVIATATEWENFFALRAHEAAEIHIQDLAFKMLDIYNESTPKILEPGDWHIPFGDRFDQSRLDTLFEYTYGFDADWSEREIKDMFDQLKIKIATARCARVSYINYEGKDDYEADIKLHDRLSGMGHWSPFEHCAKAMSDYEYYSRLKDDRFIPTFRDNDRLSLSGQNVYPKDSPKFGWSGNLKGFFQYRKMFKGENRTDDRVSKDRIVHE